MSVTDVALLNAAEFVNVSAPDWYVQQVLDDDAELERALQARDLSTLRVAWDDPSMDWSAPRLLLIRSVWDYFERYPEFSDWLNRVSAHPNIVNAPETLRWNIDKHYLADLQARGVHIPPTHFIETGSTTTLKELHEQTGWTETVIKPCVSAGGYHTYRLNPDNLEEYEAVFQEVIAKQAMMLQPFLNFVVETGEYSLMCFGGKYSFAVKKIAKSGDFRVQDNYGGTVHPYEPTPEEIAFAEASVAAVSPQPVYARVDIIRDNEGQLALAELELIEPELWLRMHPPAADAFADAIARAL